MWSKTVEQHEEATIWFLVQLINNQTVFNKQLFELSVHNVGQWLQLQLQ